MKVLTGIVTSKKMKDTAVVSVKRLWQHPLYKKMMTRNKKYLVQDDFQVKEQDVVTIKETRPISKHKTWKIVQKKEGSIKQREKTSKKKSK